jgi:hypothetical protein
MDTNASADLEEVRRLVAERLDGRDSADVAVTVEVVSAGWLRVHAHSRNPVAWYHSGVQLHADGRVVLPPSDDGSTPLGTPSTPVGTATTVPEAVDLVVTEAEKAIADIEQRIAGQLAHALPTQQPSVGSADLAAACELWQSGRDGGSSRLRGAARVLTGIPHYFRADFIDAQEEGARRSPQALRAGITLLRAVNSAGRQAADGWNAATDLPLRGFAGRGLESKPQDDQILKQLRRGQITMPLWGVSLDRDKAREFGTRFLLEIVGEFPAVPAWVASGVTAQEQELITGGRYRVLSQTEDSGTTHVRLQWIGAAGDQVGSDDVLLGVLGAVPGVTDSSLTRSAGREVLEMRLEGRGNSATVSRASGSQQAEVTRYREPDPGWDATGDDVYAQEAAMQKASRRTTVPADVESIVTAVMSGKESA